MYGCSTIDFDRAPPADWPDLRVKTYPLENVSKYCSGGLLQIAVACTILRFDLGECHIVLQIDAPNWVLQHELAHCAGYDHPGETGAVDQHQAHKERRNRR